MKLKGKHNTYPITVMETNPRERHYRKLWYARTGNLVTTSEISEEKCVEMHLVKLGKEYERINREEHEVERNCYSY